jgi:hypothetical protein
MLLVASMRGSAGGQGTKHVKMAMRQQAGVVGSASGAMIP